MVIQYALDTAADELVAFAEIEFDSIINHPILGDGTWKFKQHNDTPMVQVYTGGAIDLDVFTAGSYPTLAGAEAAIKDGTHLWDFSLTDDDIYWYFNPLITTGADDPDFVRTLGATFKIGSFNYALDQVWGDDIFADVYSTLGTGPDHMVDMVGSGGIGLTGGSFARSDIDVAVNPVPEPSTMILLGAGLVGMAVMRKRSKK